MFKMRLALALNKFKWEVDALTIQELSMWIAYYKLEPFGSQHDRRFKIQMLSFLSQHPEPNTILEQLDKYAPILTDKEKAVEEIKDLVKALGAKVG